MKKKNKIILLVIGILLVLSLMISSSYALWAFNVSQESTNVVQADCLEITFTDNNPIHLEQSFPMRDSDGVQTTPYTFTIRNICNHPADFQINLETLNTSTIDEEFIKADLNGRVTEYNAAESVEPTIEGARSAAMLYEDTLAVSGKKTYNLRLWVNETATQEDVENKSYASKISVKATVRKQYAEGTLVSGQDFNTALKKLADGDGATYNDTNTSITSIEWSNSAPQESDNAINIAATGTTTPIYAWFKEGTIYINSVLDKIYMNILSSDMFTNMQGITSLDLSHFDTSNVINMARMFNKMRSLTSLDVSNFDTSKVIYMNAMFAAGSTGEYSNIENIIGLNSFDTSKVTSMFFMFQGLKNITTLDVSHFDTSNVTNMGYMFYGMEGLTSLDISHFNTSNVTKMDRMFYGMSNLTSLDVSHFDTSKVTDMTMMFNGMSGLTSLDVGNFDTSRVTNMSYMFYGMSGLTSLDVSHFDTSNVTLMLSMFNGMSGLTSLDLSNFDTSNVTYMGVMFYGMSGLTSLDVSSFDTSKVTNMSSMFSGMRSLTSLDLSNFDTSNVTSMNSMFNEMISLTSLDISHFNTSNVKDMSSMFNDISSLTSLDISSFDNSSVTDMRRMFLGMNNLTTIYVGNNWSEDNVSNGNYMFISCSNLVGGAGTTYNSSHTDKEYARIDDPQNGKPGYFTLKTS